jgi:hypothetical protein
MDTSQVGKGKLGGVHGSNRKGLSRCLRLAPGSRWRPLAMALQERKVSVVQTPARRLEIIHLLLQGLQ